MLLSIVQPLTTGFKIAVDEAMSDIDSALNGNKVDLKKTILIFFRAAAKEYYHSAVEFVEEKLTLGPIKVSLPKFDSIQEICAIDGILSQIYNHTDATDGLVDLLQNIATPVNVIKQVHMSVFVLAKMFEL